MARGLDAGKYFWRSGREKYFSLDIPFNRTSGQLNFRIPVSHPKSDFSSGFTKLSGSGL